MDHGIKVIVADPGEHPAVREIEYGIVAMREVMGGEFAIATTSRNCAVFQPKRAKARRLPFNRVIDGQTRTFGRILIARLSDTRASDLVSIPEDEAQEWLSSL